MKRLDFHFSGRSIPAGLCAFLIGFLSAAAPNSTGQINAQHLHRAADMSAPIVSRKAP